MSVFGTKNLMNVFVAKDVAGTAIASITTDLLATVADGQVVAVGIPTGGGAEELIPATPGAGSYSHFRLVEKQAGLLNYGPLVKVSDVYFAQTKAYSAPAEQAYFIGYNGSSGSLDVSQANEFILTIAYDHDDMMWSEQKLRNAYDYYSAAPTQQGLAFSMASQINYKETLGALNGTGRMVRAEVTSNGTSGTTTTNFITVQDSATITKTTHGLTPAAGALIKVGSFYYTVVSYTANTIVLNMPYQGTSATVSVITGQTPTAFGIKVSGQPLTWVKDFFKYLKVKFHFDLKGFGASQYDRPGALIAGSESSKGVGTAYEVAEMESFAAGFEGALNRMVVPLPAGRTYTDTTTPAIYDVVVIESADNSIGSTNPVIAQTPMRVQQFVCIPDSAGVRTILASQLDDLLGSSL